MRVLTKVSVIVPVYNVETYLNQCMDSLINQNFDDFEVICVNDGSTDSSLEILEKYAGNDSRIRIITQKNGGLSSARNTGMKNASGDYIIFIDSDDWISLDCLTKLYSNAIENDSQIVQYNLEFFNEDTKCYEDDKSLNLNNLNGIDLNSYTVWDLGSNLFKIPHNAVNKLYKTSFLREVDAEFEEGLYYEDLYFFYKYFPKASKISYLNECLYFYRIRDASITTGGVAKSFDIFKALDTIRDYLIEIDFLEDFKNEFLLFICVNLKFVYLRLNNEFKNEFIQKMKDKYQDYQLGDVENFDGWHYEDQAFYHSILTSDNYKEFNLSYEKISYEILYKHYENLSNEYKNQIDELTTENNSLKEELNDSIKNKFKRIVKS